MGPSKGDVAAAMAAKAQGGGTAAAAADVIPLLPGDAMYEEMVLVSILLIQRLWRDKMRERKRAAKRRRQKELCTRRSSEAVAATLSELDEETANRSVMLIQAGIRGKAQRAKIKETEAQILLEAQSLSRTPPPPVVAAAAAAAPGKGGAKASTAVDARQQAASSNVLGRDEQTEYICELQARQDRLRKDIEKLEVDMLYTSMGEQRKRAVQVRRA